MTSLLAILSLVVALPTVSATAAAPEVDVAELLAEPEAFDGRHVAVIGELVGDYSPREDGVWVQLNDDAHVRRAGGGTGVEVNIGVGARIPSDVFEQDVVGPPGRHGRYGPLVRMEGTFLHNDAGNSGETFLDVRSVETLAPAVSYAVGDPDGWLAVGIGLLVAAGVITFAAHRRARHRAG